MLVLSRKKDESVVIGDDVTVTIIEIRGDKVRLGFDHPREISVHRKEVYEAIRREAETGRQPPVTDIHRPDVDQTTRTPATRPVAPPPPPPAPAPPAGVPAGGSSTSSARPPALLDRLAAALRARTQTAITPELLTLAIAEAAVHELAADALGSASPEQLKSLLLEALKAAAGSRRSEGS